MEAEYKEFMSLFEASGWNQAEVARRLHLKPSSISQYVHKTNRPSRQVLELFKMILVSEKPEAIGATAVLKESSPPYNVDALHAAIQQLEQQLAVVKGLTGQIKPATKKKPTRASSAMDRATAALVAKPHS